jgi:hypothetical protein
MNVRLKHDLHFTAGIHYSDSLRMNNYSLRIWMNTNSENLADQNTAFERIKYFVYTQIDSTIFINQSEQAQCQRYVDAGLNITTFPGDPVDQLIGIMLYYKLNAITEDRMIIVETEIASTQGENITYLHSDFENATGYDRPLWWTDPGLTHSDFVSRDTENVLSMSQNTAWRDLELAWTDPPVTDDTGNVVVFADFKRLDETE